jgi:AcrR family transcriptional regulator
VRVTAPATPRSAAQQPAAQQAAAQQAAAQQAAVGHTAAQRARRATVRADGTPRRITKRRAQTRARLLDAALAVFAEQGFGRASIEDVCERAGYTRGAFYSNFDSLQELFFALYEQRADDVAARVSDALASLPPGLSRDQLVAVLADRMAGELAADRDWTIVRTDFLLHAARDPAAARALAAHQAATHAALRPGVERLLRPGALPAPLDDPDTLTRSVAALYEAAVLGLLIDHDAEYARAWLRAMLTVLATGGDPAGPAGPAVVPGANL